MVTHSEPYRFSVAEYDRMVEAGILPEDARLELIDGEIVKMTPIGDRHADMVQYTHDLFVPLQAGRRTLISVQNPIRLVPSHEPQPDLVLLRPREGRYRRLPEPADILLVIEVADTSLDRDRHKATIYAGAGIPEYWLIDIGSTPATITVYREPRLDGYHSIQVMRAGDELTSLAFPELPIDIVALLS